MKQRIAIIGAGPAGAVAACGLCADFHVSLIDPIPQGQRPLCLGESLPSASRRILSELGLWEFFLSQNHQRITQKRSRWGSDELQFQDSFLNLDGTDFLLDRAAFENGLLDQAIARGAHHITSRFLSATRLQSCWSLQTQAGNIEADWVIDATGRRAAFARQVGAQRIPHDRLVAYWWLGKSKISHLTGSYIQSAMNGWWYTTVTPNHERILIYFTDADLSAPNNFEVPFLKDILEEDHFSPLQPMKKTAAHSSTLTTCHGEHWLAIGDASINFDPLSSQGLFHALYTARRAIDFIKNPSPIDYPSEIDSIWKSYLYHYQHYYHLESRWPDSPFWQRRKQSPL